MGKIIIPMRALMSLLRSIANQYLKSLNRPVGNKQNRLMGNSKQKKDKWSLTSFQPRAFKA